MWIGTEQNSLQISGLGGAPPYSTFHIEAKRVAPGWLAWVFAQRVRLDVEDAEAVVDDFTTGRLSRLKLAFADAGWLRIRRHIGGQIIVLYRICRVETGEAIEGEIILNPTSADQFNRELRALFVRKKPRRSGSRAVRPRQPK